MSYGPPNDPNQQGQQPPQQPGYQQPPQQQQPYMPYQPGQQNIQPGGQGFNPQHVPVIFKSFSMGRKLFIGAGLFAVLMFFLPWYSVSVRGETIGTVSGLQGGLFLLLTFFALLLLVIAIALPLFGKRLNQIVSLPYSEGKIAFMGGIAILVMSILFRLLNGAGTSFGMGFILAVLALGGMTAGGYLMDQGRE